VTKHVKKKSKKKKRYIPTRTNQSLRSNRLSLEQTTMRMCVLFAHLFWWTIGMIRQWSHGTIRQGSMRWES